MPVHHPPSSFHVHLGDLPTWLGVAAASVAAVFVYLQLRSQNKEIARQVAALERQQADRIDLSFTYGAAIRFRMSDPDEAAPAGDRLTLVVRNGSRRPIRRVRCEVQPLEGKPPIFALIGSADAHAEPDRLHDFTVYNPSPGFRANLMAAGELRAFVFDYDVLGGLFYTAEFTDDAGLHWRIDQDLHLQKLERRSGPYA